MHKLFFLGSLLLASACKDPGDEDGDGFRLEDGDCDDLNAAIYPGAPESCDGIDDNDCGDDTNEINVPGDFATLQEGVSNRDEQSLICVEPGTYTENLSIVGSATLIGVGGSEQTILEGASGETILSLRPIPALDEPATITLSGLKVTGETDEDHWAIDVEGVSAIIDDLTLISASQERLGLYAYESDLVLSNFLATGSECADEYSDCWSLVLDNSTFDITDLSIVDNLAWGMLVYASAGSLSRAEIAQLGTENKRTYGPLLALSSDLTVTDLSVRDNHPAVAAVTISESQFSFEGLTISDNSSENSNYSEAGFTVDASVISGNHLWVENNGGRWGAVVSDYSSFDVSNMVVINNRGYGYQQYYVDAETTTTITHALVAGNDELGMRVYGPLTLENAIVAGHQEDGLVVTDKATLSHLTVFANQTPGDNMSANVEIGTKKVTMSNSIVADGLWGFSGPYNGGTKLTLKWVDVWGHDNGNATDWNGLDNSLPGTGGMSVNPKLMNTGSGAPDKWDFRLQSSSPLIDQGDPDVQDPDGSPSDLGAFSGPNAGNFDLDGDGIKAWWGPGGHPGFLWDCDDLDADVQGECWQ